MDIKEELSRETGLSKIYDILYGYAEEIINKYDPCHFSYGKCAVPYVDCCKRCSHLSATGCEVKALSCKLWLCDEIASRFPECYHELTKLQMFAAQYGLLGLGFADFIGFRESKDEAMRRLSACGRNI